MDLAVPEIRRRMSGSAEAQRRGRLGPFRARERPARNRRGKVLSSPEPFPPGSRGRILSAAGFLSHGEATHLFIFDLRSVKATRRI